MCAEIDSVTQSIESATTATIEWSNEIRNIDWSIFDLIQERISDVTEEVDFLVELMSNKDLFDDNGNFTEQGVATTGLYAMAYNVNMHQADLAGEEAEKLKKQLIETPNDRNLEEQYRKRIAEQREYILAAEDAKNAIVDLVENGIELELEALDKQIQKYEEALDSQKDLYDYQKQVSEQSAEISKLEKQRAAYLNDDSEESRAKLQEITVSLKEAKDSLEETEFERYISQQQQLLDELYLEYETTLNTRLDDVDGLISQVVDGINTAFGAEGGTITSALGADGAIASALAANATSIGSTLKTEAEAVGTKLSATMDNIWKADGSGKAVLDLYGKDFQSKHTTTNDALNDIKANVAAMVDDVDKEAQNKIDEPQIQPSSNEDPVKNNGNQPEKEEPKKDNEPKITNDTLMGIASAIWIYGKKSGWGNNPFRENKLSNKIGDANAAKVQDYINQYGRNGKLYAFWLKKGMNLKKYYYNAFATGAKNINETQLAWTQENGQEFIVRPSDGAILTPIAKGDSVLTSAASSNIWDMANNPADFIKDNLNLGTTNVPNNSSVQSVYNQTIENVTFDFKNVKNYEEMLYALRDDRRFEKLITSMTIDRVAGKSNLAKGKSIR